MAGSRYGVGRFGVGLYSAPSGTIHQSALRASASAGGSAGVKRIALPSVSPAGATSAGRAEARVGFFGALAPINLTVAEYKAGATLSAVGALRSATQTGGDVRPTRVSYAAMQAALATGGRALPEGGAIAASARGQATTTARAAGRVQAEGYAASAGESAGSAAPYRHVHSSAEVTALSGGRAAPGFSQTVAARATATSAARAGGVVSASAGLRAQTVESAARAGVLRRRKAAGTASAASGGYAWALTLGITAERALRANLATGGRAALARYLEGALPEVALLTGGDAMALRLVSAGLRSASAVEAARAGGHRIAAGKVTARLTTTGQVGSSVRFEGALRPASLASAGRGVMVDLWDNVPIGDTVWTQVGIN